MQIDRGGVGRRCPVTGRVCAQRASYSDGAFRARVFPTFRRSGADFPTGLHGKRAEWEISGCTLAKSVSTDPPDPSGRNARLDKGDNKRRNCRVREEGKRLLNVVYLSDCPII